LDNVRLWNADIACPRAGLARDVAVADMEASGRFRHAEP
jgi:hypothetical protein